MKTVKKILAGILAIIIAFGSDSVVAATNIIEIRQKLENTVKIISEKEAYYNKSSGNEIKHKYQETDNRDLKKLNKRIHSDIKTVTSTSNVENKSEITAKANDLVLEDKNYIYTLNNENATITGYTGDGGNISVPESLDGHTVVSIAQNAFSGCSSITGIILPKSITYIGASFASGTQITSITIPKSVVNVGVTSYGNFGKAYGPLTGAMQLKEVIFEEGMTTIPAYMCRTTYDGDGNNIEKIYMPDSIENIGACAFYNCDSLTQIVMPKSIEYIGESAFSECNNITDLEFVYNDDHDVKIEAYAFRKCKKLKNTFLTNNIISIGEGAFSECSSIINITLPESISYLGACFVDGTQIESITIPKNLTNVGVDDYGNYGKAYGPLTGALQLKEVIFEDGITTIPAYMCRTTYNDNGSDSTANQIERVYLPESVNNIGNFAFYGCINIKEIELPKHLTSVGYYAFTGTGIAKITIPKDLKKCESGNGGWRSGPFAGAIHLKEVIFEEGIETIPANIFASETRQINITQIVIPDGVKKIGSEAFYCCNNLTAILIPESVTEIAYSSFYKCDKLVIYGYEDSYAKTYADEYNIPFKNASEFDFGDGSENPKDENVVVGILEEVSHADRTLTISGKKYKVSDDFSIPDAGNIIASSGDKHVICTTENGIIVKLVKISDVLEPHIFITTEGDDITYQNWEFTPSSQKIKVHVSCGVKGNYPVDTFWDSGIKMHIDSFKLTIQDDGINFGKKGVFNKEEVKEIDQKVKKDVLINPSTTYDFTVNVNDGYEPSPVNKQKFKIKAVVTADSQTMEHEKEINVINLDYQRQIAEQKKEAQAAKNNTLSNAQKELERLCNGFTITDPPFMQEFLDKQQMTAFRAFLYTWLAEVNNANTYSDDDKVNKKINEKLGIDENLLFKGRPTKATTYFEAETKNHGERRFEITLEITTFQSGGKAWGSFGKLTCKIVDKKGIPGNMLISADIPVVYANMDNFCDYVKGAAESAVKKAFNESWGKKADQVAEMFVNKTIMDVIKKQWGSFSKGVYKLFTKPTEDYVKKVKAECPVDVYIYDMDGNLCGSIINNVVDDSNAEIAMAVRGDAKIFYLTGNDYSVKLVGNDKGTMTYTVEELDENLKNLRTIMFNNLSLEKGTTYKGFVMEPVYIDNALYSLEKDGKDMIYSDTDTYQDALTKNLVEGISLSVSEQSLQQDTALQLIATVYPETAANKSIRWESDNEQVAIVDDTGLVTAVGVGEAVITAKSRDGSNILAACKIGVTAKSNGDQNNDSSGGGTTGDNPSGGGTTGGNPSGGGTAGGNPSSGTTGGNPSGGGTTGGSPSGGGTTGGNPSGGGTTGGNPSGDNSTGNDNNNGDNNGDDQPDTPIQIKLLYYIVEFNANGGTKLSRKTMTLLNDDNLGILPKVQRKNYTFNGWYTQKSGGTKVNSSTVLNAGTTLFAQWTKVDKPSKVKTPSLKSKKAGQLAVSFQKITGAKGYEIAYSTNKKFPSSSTKKTVSASAKKTLKKLKSGKKYYVKVRAYQVDSTGKKVYGAYSKAKGIKVK